MPEVSKDAQKRSLGKRIRIGLIAAVIILTIIVILQNTESVSTNLLFATVTMPRSVLLLLTLLIGFAGGALTTGIVLSRRK
ncbi:MAG: LapA family protein [Phycisphaerales bacterium]|nr:MAG: LapA family protein [Phycisphaerales bacterium]